MISKKVVIFGCAGLLLVGIAVLAALALFVAHVSKDLEGVTLTVKAPEEVKVGDTMELVVTVKNERVGKEVKLADVDISDEYLAGFTVSSSTPNYKTTIHIPIDNSQSFTFDINLPPGKETNIVFTLRAIKEGVYRGDVDASEGMLFVTALAQTVVKEKDSNP